MCADILHPSVIGKFPSKETFMGPTLFSKPSKLQLTQGYFISKAFVHKKQNPISVIMQFVCLYVYVLHIPDDIRLMKHVLETLLLRVHLLSLLLTTAKINMLFVTY